MQDEDLFPSAGEVEIKERQEQWAKHKDNPVNKLVWKGKTYRLPGDAKIMVDGKSLEEFLTKEAIVDETLYAGNGVAGGAGNWFPALSFAEMPQHQHNLTWTINATAGGVNFYPMAQTVNFVDYQMGMGQAALCNAAIMTAGILGI